MLLHKLMHNPVMTHLRKPCHKEYARLVLRLAVAGVFMYHGAMKLAGLEGAAMFFERLGIPMPGAMAVLVAIVEFFGGALVGLGLATRFWSAGHMVIMVVAILTAKEIGSFKTYELEFMLLASSLSLVLSGGGCYSLDAWLMRKGESEHASAMPMAAPKA